MSKTNKEPAFDLVIDDEAKAALRAAKRSAEKLREWKRKMGYKLIVWKDGKVVEVDP